eukprot:m.156474 g.156474  ORF g.156474 m.156474 type:complete len:129 (+) comp17938_c0_seq2:2415-2801(+)
MHRVMRWMTRSLGFHCKSSQNDRRAIALRKYCSTLIQIILPDIGTGDTVFTDENLLIDIVDAVLCHSIVDNVRSHHVQYDHLLLFFSAAPSASSLFHVFVSLEKSDEPALEDTPLAALPAVSTLPRAA